MTYEFYHNKLRLLNAAFAANIVAYKRDRTRSYSEHYNLYIELNKWRLIKAADFSYVCALAPENFPVKINLEYSIK